MTNFTLTALRSRKVKRAIETRNNVEALARLVRNVAGAALTGPLRLAGQVFRATGGIAVKLVKFGGFLWSQAVGFLNLDFSTIWDICFESFISIKEFDWNQTDIQLHKALVRNNQRIVEAAAQTLGEVLPFGIFSIANLAVGRFIGTATGIKLPVLSARIGLALAEEGADELRQSMRSFFSRSLRNIAGNFLISAVLTARRRRWLGQDTVIHARPDGSISARIDRRIQKLPEFWQDPVQEFLESFEDGMHEAGYVVAFTIDDHMAALKADRVAREKDRVLEVTPRKGAQPLTFVGPQSQVEQAVTTTLATYERFEQGGLGIPGTWPLKPGFDRPQLVITFRNQNKDKSGVLHIPHYDGPRDPKIPAYQTGSWQAKWVLKDGSHLMAYTATKLEGIKLLRSLGRYVPAFYRVGSPEAILLDRKIKSQKVEPRVAEFYAKGPAPEPTWKAYFNFSR